MVGKWMIPTVPFKEAYFLEDALKFRAEIKMPLVYVGGLVSREKIDEVLNDGFEAVQMARALLNEPGFVNRMREEEKAICNCKHSNYCIARMYSIEMPSAFERRTSGWLEAGNYKNRSKRIMKQKLAVITGADGGMGMEITRAVATAGYKVIMACRDPEIAEEKRQLIMRETGNIALEIVPVNLASLSSTASFANELFQRGEVITLLMNNAGTMETRRCITEDGLERTVSVNYVAPYLLTRKLLPLMGEGSRIVNMVSCTYAIGKLDFPDFFLRGKKGAFWRIPIYSNTKLALTLFTIALSKKVKEKGIIVNAADPGIVSTKIITMHMWFDPLTDIFFRPFIRTPRQGAATAISLLLDEDAGKRTGTLNVSCHPKQLSEKFFHHVQMKELWDKTEEIVAKWL